MKRKGEILDDEELNNLINQVDGSPSSKRKNKWDQERTEINFETFKNYIFKLSPMSPSMRPELIQGRNREDTQSFDISDEETGTGDNNITSDNIDRNLRIDSEDKDEIKITIDL